MGRLFGTDGVRGVAGHDLTARLAMDLATAAAQTLGDAGAFAAARATSRRPFAVLGRDPRASGEYLEAAVVAGLTGAGVDVLRLGVIPTPAVAYLTGELGAEFGVMLSASHNPAPDNGIKFFGTGGLKLPDEVEDDIEDRLKRNVTVPGPPAAGFGRVRDASVEPERYLDHLVDSLRQEGTAPSWPERHATAEARPLTGLRVVVDCAHGAAYALAPEALRRAGADVIAIGAEPDGVNINQGCGSTSLGALSAAVVAHNADAGIAHDGDADRCLAVDAAGRPIDGDQILAILALGFQEAGRLKGGTVVATVMSNLGFRLAMSDAGIQVVETAVGDRYVLEAMRAGNYVLGGEQSGHIILLDHATTGDGILTGLQLLATVARSGKPLAELATVMTRYPQVLINVQGVDKSRVGSAPELAAAVAAAETELGALGRVLVRPSGTEPTVRVMVEATDAIAAERVAGQLAESVRTALG
ncbi:MAG TPA: phosphoglucosamine mutase [Streptosporangiaceae bacterium]|nr:phosphoglucosamine mutase [Streptosporangiaceae bacterium]